MASRISAGNPGSPAEPGNVRGTKRTCQNEACGARFYDLNRDPIVCPICGTPYVLHMEPEKFPATAAEPGFRRPAAGSAPLPADEAPAADEIEEIEVEEVDDADVGLEIVDEDDVEDDIEDVRGPGRGHDRPD